ncbi:MAG: hypothetical protein WKG07_19680 [Hymenobacter sp.]
MASKRESTRALTPGDKRYIRRDDDGQIETSVDLNRSLSQDDRTTPKKPASPARATTATATPGIGSRRSEGEVA